MCTWREETTGRLVHARPPGAVQRQPDCSAADLYSLPCSMPGRCAYPAFYSANGFNGYTMSKERKMKGTRKCDRPHFPKFGAWIEVPSPCPLYSQSPLPVWRSN